MHNAQQQQAIDSSAPTIVVVAGPGSGKTATTVARIRRLVETGTDPRGIVALTFTNNAARELEERLAQCPNCGGHGWVTSTGCDGEPEQSQCLCQSLDYGRPALGYCGTLHGFALRMLKQHGASIGYGDRMAIIDPDAASALLQSKADSLGCKMKLADLEKLKSRDLPRTGRAPTLPETVIAAYYDEIREAGIVDFDVMLSEFLRLITTQSDSWMNGTAGAPNLLEFTHLFVDEAQDSSSTDWLIYRALPIVNKFYVGDPDQAIYSFRGGNVREFLAVASCAPETIYLETNYRSRAEICNAANNLIAHNTVRLEKKTTSAKGPGGTVDINGYIPNMVLYENEGEEIGRTVRGIATRLQGSTSTEPDLPRPSIAVLTRTNAVAYEYRKALIAAGLPVKSAPKSEMPKDWKMARAFLAWLVQPDNDLLAFFSIIESKVNNGAPPAAAMREAHAIRKQANAAGQSINEALYHFRAEASPGSANVAQILIERGFSLETRMIIAQKINELGPEATMLDLALALADTRTGLPDLEAADEPAINVTTIHGAKGLEWDVVYIVGAEQEITPGTRKTITPEDIEEERRLFYVAITRARQSLHVRWARSRKTEWGQIVGHQPSQFLGEMLK